MIIAIDWNTQSIKEWQDNFARLPRSNILQTYEYAMAQRIIARQKPRWGLIRIDGHPAGLVQILEAGIFKNALHALILDRGPLWFDGYGSALHVKLFFDELNRQFPLRFGRRRRVLPETQDGPTAQKLIAQTGFALQGPGYATAWLDLTPAEEILRSRLKQKWRNSLNKAERAGQTVEWDRTGSTMPWALPLYAGDRALKKYAGPEPVFLKTYLPLAAAGGNYLLGRAFKNKETLAFVLFITHGRSATYLLGWSSPLGRENVSHHLLLWEGIKMLKQKGIKELDLGGLNDEDASGIKTFKEGLGGDTVRYVGRYA
jgi:hypothetical protein